MSARLGYAPFVAPPQVSVCIPVFNSARFLRETLASVFAQSFQDFEIVVVDNASTDETPAILDAVKDPRVRVVRNAVNIGPVGNFNRALELARGTYVKLLCADDLLCPDCLELQVCAMRGDDRDDVVMVCCARAIVDESGRRWMTRGYPGGPGRIEGKAAMSEAVRQGRNLFGEPAAVLLRRTAVESTQGFDPAYRYCLDIEFWSRILQQGAVWVQSEELCGFRVSSQSWSMALSGSQYAEMADLLPRLAVRHSVPLARPGLALALTRAFVNAGLRRCLYYGVHARTVLAARWAR